MAPRYIFQKLKTLHLLTTLFSYGKMNHKRLHILALICMILFLLEINFIMTVAIKCCIQINLRVIALDNLVFHDSIKSPALLELKF